ncbi:hypothetical protein [Nocardia nova]|uniref:hypothetical protein n=1 Tax=Nocardia nova TaxID=37330 RepID=UPI0011B0E3FD|nr:hypothetical protein [Nocardia nova]
MGIEPGQAVVDDVGGRVELDQPVADLHEPMYRLLATDPPQPHLVDEPLTFDRDFRDDRVHSAPVPFQLVSQSVSAASRNHPAIRHPLCWVAPHRPSREGPRSSGDQRESDSAAARARPAGRRRRKAWRRTRFDIGRNDRWVFRLFRNKVWNTFLCNGLPKFGQPFFAGE